ncbi:hypothetical protein SK128_004564, partial [Halocaridina rubra]
SETEPRRRHCNDRSLNLRAGNLSTHIYNKTHTRNNSVLPLWLPLNAKQEEEVWIMSVRQKSLKPSNKASKQEASHHVPRFTIAKTIPTVKEDHSE